ncbi:MAG: cell envelope integrity protein CreD [Bacteroidota bacterium]
METTPNNTIEQINQRVKSSITLKLVSIAVLTLLLLIPATMIKSLITERELYRDDATVDITSRWGGSQSVAGPILTVPYRTFTQRHNGEVLESIKYAHFLPKQLEISGQMDPQIRKRNIYEVVLYGAYLNFQGQFEQPDFSNWKIDPAAILWEDAFLSFGISDMSGIKKYIDLNWSNQKRRFEPGLTVREVVRSGVTTRVPVNNDSIPSTYNFQFNVELNGSELLSFIPLGQETSVKMRSTWKDPSFGGAFLPDKPETSADGFYAEWNLLDLNRDYPQQWLGSTAEINDSAFGVELILPVDEYQKNMRSAKYALLVIALTFLVFFLVELLNKKRFHPIQYVMVGLAITLFYALLLSMTEHLGFNLAYMASAAMITVLVGFYASYMFKSKVLTGLLSMFMVLIYAFIFIILQMQDFSLLVGSLGLFVALAVTMYLSRNIDWYQIGKKQVSNTNMT